MTRPLALALVLSIAVMLALAPSAEAKKRRKHKHVLACAAMVGAPCQALVRSNLLSLSATQGDEQMALKLRRKRRLGLVALMICPMS
jgi:hypothetical protein